MRDAGTSHQRAGTAAGAGLPRPEASAAQIPAQRGRTAMRALVVTAIVAAVGVAVLGGVRSFEAVSARFGSPLVPLTADGMIIACTALRLAALTRGWRLPGSLLTTYVFIVGTIWLNVAAATGWADAVAHALAPAAYAVLVELLAHMLRLQLRLAKPRAARVSALTWVTSPVITTRVWLHLARTGGEDPREARALVQQVVRMRSRLRSVCPNGWHPFDGARPARTAALHTIRDGLLTAAEVAALLPDADRLTPSALLARIDRAALHTGPSRQASGAPVREIVEPDRTAEDSTVRAPVDPDQEAPVHAPPPSAVHRADPSRAPARSGGPTRRVRSGAGRDGRTDAELVAVLRQHSVERNGGQALSQRQVRELLGVGFPKARRLVEAAGWADDRADSSGNAAQTEPEPAKPHQDQEPEPIHLEMSDAR